VNLIVFLIFAIIVLLLVHVAMSFLPIPERYRTPIWILVAVILLLWLLGQLSGYGPTLSLR
jgi:hypothetical protein